MFGSGKKFKVTHFEHTLCRIFVVKVDTKTDEVIVTETQMPQLVSDFLPVEISFIPTIPLQNRPSSQILQEVLYGLQSSIFNVRGIHTHLVQLLHHFKWLQFVWLYWFLNNLLHLIFQCIVHQTELRNACFVIRYVGCCQKLATGKLVEVIAWIHGSIYVSQYCRSRWYAFWCYARFTRFCGRTIYISICNYSGL